MEVPVLVSRALSPGVPFSLNILSTSSLLVNYLSSARSPYPAGFLSLQSHLFILQIVVAYFPCVKLWEAFIMHYSTLGRSLPQFLFLLIPTTSWILHTFSSTQPQQSFNEHLFYTLRTHSQCLFSPSCSPNSSFNNLHPAFHMTQSQKLTMCTYCILARNPLPCSSHLPHCPFPPINPKRIYHSLTVFCSNNNIPIPAADSSTLFSFNP